RNYAGRIAADDGGRLHVSGNDAATGYKTVGANPHSWQQGGARPNPRARFDHDRLGDQVKRRTPVVVAARAEIGALRDAYVAADFYVGEVVDPSFLANPAVVAHGQPPRILDSYMRLDDQAATNASAKQSQ